MIINAPSTIRRGKSLKIVVRIEQKNGKDTEMFFRFHHRFENLLAQDMTPFASALLLPAMRMKEPLIIKGSVSQAWLKHTKQIQDKVISWSIGLSRINIIPDASSKDHQKLPKIALFFSAGVDSFSTYLKYKSHDRDKITHFIFVQGFDIDIDNTRLYRKTARKIRIIAKQEGIECIMIKTNLRRVIDPWLNWEMAHGGALASISLLFRHGFTKVIVPGSGFSKLEEPWGSCSKLDPLWSTETLEIVHDLDSRTRLKKVQELIAHSPLALKNLRVCWKNKDYNCCHCDKCLCTMIELRVAGVLEKARTFPRPLDLLQVSQLYTTPYTVQEYFEEAVDELKRTGRDPLMLEALLKSLNYSKYPDIKRKFISIIHNIDMKYNESRLYAYLEKWKQRVP